jgi:NitT/TauT family transport system substrate-binding protein
LRRTFIPLVLVALVAPGACATRSTTASRPVALRLGYFPNVTHATAIAGLKQGIFAGVLGSDVKLTTATFNAGPAAVEAIFANSIDATYIGPNPAINAYQRSRGQAVRVVAGATSGGASLVVKPSIATPAALKGKKIATPQRGNTQDVALRAYLETQGFTSTLEGGGDVSVVPQDNAQTLETFKAGRIDGAWVPEPWASRLVIEGGGKVLVDEATLWPQGNYVTTLLLVRTAYLKQHRDVVSRLLQGHLQATDWVRVHPGEARKSVNEGIQDVTGKALSDDVISSAWTHLSFTVDPLLATLRKEASDAKDAGLLEDVDLAGISDLGPLNGVLRAAGRSPVTA